MAVSFSYKHGHHWFSKHKKDLLHMMFRLIALPFQFFVFGIFANWAFILSTLALIKPISSMLARLQPLVPSVV